MIFLVIYLCFYWILLNNSESILSKDFLAIKLYDLFSEVYQILTGLSDTNSYHLLIAQKAVYPSLVKCSMPWIQTGFQVAYFQLYWDLLILVENSFDLFSTGSLDETQCGREKYQGFYSIIILVLYTLKGKCVNWAFKTTILTPESCVNSCLGFGEVVTQKFSLLAVVFSLLWFLWLFKRSWANLSLVQVLVFNLLWIMLVQKTRTKTRNFAIVCSVVNFKLNHKGKTALCTIYSHS